jgi:hypothetical protein
VSFVAAILLQWLMIETRGKNEQKIGHEYSSCKNLSKNFCK